MEDNLNDDFDPVELRKALASAATDIIKGDKEARKAVAAQVVKTLSDELEQADISTLMLTKETLGLNEVPKYELDGELMAYIHIPGSYAPMTHPRKKEFTIPQEMISCHIMLPLLQLQSGRYGSIADQVDKAKRAIQGQVNKMVVDTIIAAVPSTSTLGNYGTAAKAVATFQPALNTGINYIEDQVGGGRVIAGRRNVVSTIGEFNQIATTLDIFPESVKEEYIKRGTIGVYKGLPIAGYKQYTTQIGIKTLDTLNCFVMGNDVGRIAWWQDMQSVDDIEVGTLNWHIHAWILVGAAVFFPERIYRLLLT